MSWVFKFLSLLVGEFGFLVDELFSFWVSFVDEFSYLEVDKAFIN